MLSHCTLLLTIDTSITESCFCFGSAASFLLGLLVIALCSSPVAYLLIWGAHLLVSYLFTFVYSSWGSHNRITGVVCHSLLQWTTFVQSSPLWPDHLGFPAQHGSQLHWVMQAPSPCWSMVITRQWSVRSFQYWYIKLLPLKGVTLSTPTRHSPVDRYHLQL